MLKFVPIRLFVGIIAFTILVGLSVYGACMAMFGLPLSLRSILAIVSAAVTLLNFTFSIFLYFGWRLLWRRIPALNRIVFPDINGRWNMEIHWQKETDSGVVNAVAEVNQSFLKISMEVLSEDSSSQTLIAEPKKDAESGSPSLYYIYLVTPKLLDGKIGSPYFGSAILKIPSKDVTEFGGNYWTDKQSKGHFRLNKIVEPEVA